MRIQIEAYFTEDLPYMKKFDSLLYKSCLRANVACILMFITTWANYN